jgi:hypothetical protein
VLALSDIRMLRDFGLVTLIDLTVSLLGVLVALPAALVIADAAAEGGGRGEPVRLLGRLGEALARLLGGLRAATVRRGWRGGRGHAVGGAASRAASRAAGSAGAGSRHEPA